MIMLMLNLDALPGHVTRGNSLSGEWLTGTTSVTSPEGDDVNMSCIFSGRYVGAAATGFKSDFSVSQHQTQIRSIDISQLGLPGN